MLHSLVKLHSKVALHGQGTLGVLDFGSLSFVPKRVYWLTETPVTAERGNHAHKELTQLLIAVAGSVTVDIHEGEQEFSYNLDTSSAALLLKPGTWRVLRNFSMNACILVICDKEYEEADYVRNYRDYLLWFKEQYA